MRLRSIFLANDSFVFANCVTQREPGMADGHNGGRSSQASLASAPRAWPLLRYALHSSREITVYLQKSLNRSGDSSVYLTVCWMLRWPR